MKLPAFVYVECGVHYFCGNFYSLCTVLSVETSLECNGVWLCVTLGLAKVVVGVHEL